MEYKLQPVNLEAESVDKVEFPELRDRIIEKRGHLITFSLREMEDNDALLERHLKEIEAQDKHEKVVRDNIEQHHPFVKDMSEEDQHTVYMYYATKKKIQVCEAKINEIKTQLELDRLEIEEIKRQIPELNTPIKDEAVKIMKNAKSKK